MSSMSEQDLWRKYCGFYDKSFPEQLEYCRKNFRRHADRLMQTNVAKLLHLDSLKRIEEAPLTTYFDYDILARFGKTVVTQMAKYPRMNGELMYGYHQRIVKDVIPMLDGWLPDKYGIYIKTSGSTGENKWIVHGEEFWRNLSSAVIAGIIMACSDKWGETKIKAGDGVLNNLAPIPYISGWSMHAMASIFKPVPPISVTDNVAEMRRKFYLTLGAIEKGEKVSFGGGIAAPFYLMCRYFTDQPDFYKNYYKSMNFGVAKTLLFLMYLKARLRSKKYRIEDVLPLKGVGISGADSNLYYNLFKDEFGFEPLNVYGSSEFGMSMIGTPERKTSLLASLNYCYFEFIDEKGELRAIDELKEDDTYRLVGTPFGSLLLRYDIGDVFRVVDLRDDGAPIFMFEGRQSNIIDIYGYFRLTEATASTMMVRAGLRLSDRWAIAKVLDPKELLLVVMEKDWEYSEEKAANVLFNALLEVSEEFRNYVRDYKVNVPEEVIRVEYLKRGAFLRYIANRTKSGVPLGQVKPPKLIPASRHDILESLRGA